MTRRERCYLSTFHGRVLVTLLAERVWPISNSDVSLSTYVRLWYGISNALLMSINHFHTMVCLYFLIVPATHMYVCQQCEPSRPTHGKAHSTHCNALVVSPPARHLLSSWHTHSSQVGRYPVTVSRSKAGESVVAEQFTSIEIIKTS